MSLKEVSQLYPLSSEIYTHYLKPDINPPLDPNRINTSFLIGDERTSRLETPFAGDGSLVVSYERKGIKYEGIIISLQQRNRDLLVLQIQGARSKVSYRLTTGLNLNIFAVDQIKRIGCFLTRSQLVDRLAFPLWITGLENAASERVFDRYRTVTALLGLSPAPREQLIVGKTIDLNGNCKSPCSICPTGK